MAASIVALQALKSISFVPALFLSHFFFSATQVPPNKRSSELTAVTERVSDNKRPRLQEETATDSPKQTLQTTPAPFSSQPRQTPLQTPPLTQAQLHTESQPPQPSMSHIAPPVQPVSHVPGPQLPPGITPQQILQKCADASKFLRNHAIAIQAAVAEGDMEKAKTLAREYEKNKILVEKMQETFMRQANMMRQNPQMQIGPSMTSTHGLYILFF